MSKSNLSGGKYDTQTVPTLFPVYIDDEVCATVADGQLYGCTCAIDLKCEFFQRLNKLDSNHSDAVPGICIQKAAVDGELCQTLPTSLTE